MQFAEVKGSENTVTGKTEPQREENWLREVIDYCSNKKISTTRIFNEPLNLVLGKDFRLVRSSDFAISSRRFNSINQQILPPKTTLSTHILTQAIPFRVQRLNSALVNICISRNFSFKLIKREPIESRWSTKSNKQEFPIKSTENYAKPLKQEHNYTPDQVFQQDFQEHPKQVYSETSNYASQHGLQEVAKQAETPRPPDHTFQRSTKDFPRQVGSETHDQALQQDPRLIYAEAFDQIRQQDPQNPPTQMYSQTADHIQKPPAQVCVQPSTHTSQQDTQNVSQQEHSRSSDHTTQQTPVDQSHSDCQNAQHPSMELVRSVEKSSPVYSDKPEGYKSTEKTETNLGDYKRAWENYLKTIPKVCKPQYPQESSQPDGIKNNRFVRWSNQTSCKSPDPGQTAYNTAKKESTILSKIEGIVFGIRKQSSDVIRACLLALEKRKQQKSLEDSLSDEIQPDPPPPKSLHWSERSETDQYVKKRSPSSAPSPVVFCPYGESSKNERQTKCEYSRNTCSSYSSPSYKKSFETADRTFTQHPSTGRYTESQPNFIDPTSTKLSQVRVSKSDASYTNSDSKKRRQVEGVRKTCERRLKEAEAKYSRQPDRMYLPRRKQGSHYRSSGEWQKQKYQIRVKIYKSKDGLDPRPPILVEVREGSRDS